MEYKLNHHHKYTSQTLRIIHNPPIFNYKVQNKTIDKRKRGLNKQPWKENDGETWHYHSEHLS